MSRPVVVIGAGQAGYQAAASLRQGGFEDEIFMVGNEPGLPYQRPPLSKAYLLGKVSAEALAFKPARFFSEHRIEMITESAVEIQRSERRVVLEGGAAIQYGHLILATGARNRPLEMPGSDLDGVFGLRTLREAASLSAHIRQASAVVVLGAGFIGLEFAAVARALGVSVHVVEIGTRPMARAVSPATSSHFQRALEAAGVTFDFQTKVERILGCQGRVAGVQLADGRLLEADTVVFGIGVLPNVELAAQAGLRCENGIQVDRHLVTTDPAVSAIGDCASFPDPRSGRWIRLESVQNAADQARHVAARLTGRVEPFEAVPWFWSEQGSLKLQIAGLASVIDEFVTIGDTAGQRFSILCYQGGRLVAVESTNSPMDHMAARRLLARGARTPSVAEAAQPGFALQHWQVSVRGRPD